MSVNVRCAGLPIITREREAPDEYDRTEPCGWTGQARGLDSSLPYMIEDTRVVPDVLIGRIPCPNCGGVVELITEDQGSGGVW